MVDNGWQVWSVEYFGEEWVQQQSCAVVHLLFGEVCPLWAAAILTGSSCIWWPPTPLIPNPVQPIHYSRHSRHQIVASRRKGPWKVGCKRPVDKALWRKVCAKYEQDCECGDMDIKLVRFPTARLLGLVFELKPFCNCHEASGMGNLTS